MPAAYLYWSHSTDIANVRIEFDNGCVNLTASRTAVKMWKMLFFQRDYHVTLDFLHRETEVLKLFYCKTQFCSTTCTVAKGT